MHQNRGNYFNILHSVHITIIKYLIFYRYARVNKLYRHCDKGFILNDRQFIDNNNPIIL